MADENEPIGDDSIPPDLFSPLEQMAIVTHETFVAFARAGFTENQALALTMKTLELSYMNGLEFQDLQELDLDEDE